MSKVYYPTVYGNSILHKIQNHQKRSKGSTRQPHSTYQHIKNNVSFQKSLISKLHRSSSNAPSISKDSKNNTISTNIKSISSAITASPVRRMTKTSRKHHLHKHNQIWIAAATEAITNTPSSLTNHNNNQSQTVLTSNDTTLFTIPPPALSPSLLSSIRQDINLSPISQNLINEKLICTSIISECKQIQDSIISLHSADIYQPIISSTLDHDIININSNLQTNNNSINISTAIATNASISSTKTVPSAKAVVQSTYNKQRHQITPSVSAMITTSNSEINIDIVTESKITFNQSLIPTNKTATIATASSSTATTSTPMVRIGKHEAELMKCLMRFKRSLEYGPEES